MLCLAKQKKNKAKSDSEDEDEDVGSDIEEIEKELVKMKIEETKVEEKSKPDKKDSKKPVCILFLFFRKIVLFCKVDIFAFIGKEGQII